MPRFNWVEKRNIHARDGIPGVSSIFDHLAARGLSYRNYSYYDGSDEQILRLARQDLSRTDAGFFFVYLCEMDMFLHTHRDDPDKVARRLAWYEKSLRGLLAAARAVAPHTRMALFSDHGMAPVRNHFDLMSEIARTGMQVPRDYLAVYDSTMARFWFFSEAARQAIAACLHNVPCGRILEESELRDLGVFFQDQRYGELVFLLQPGWIVAKSDFNGPQWTPAGMHGYHPDDPDSDAVFLSTFRPDKPMRTIADIYSVMEGRVA
jgi:predicted AlkP superfamily pyrophosphatase or phosphodiesterase